MGENMGGWTGAGGRGLLELRGLPLQTWGPESFLGFPCPAPGRHISVACWLCLLLLPLPLTPGGTSGVFPRMGETPPPLPWEEATSWGSGSSAWTKPGTYPVSSGLFTAGRWDGLQETRPSSRCLLCAERCPPEVPACPDPRNAALFGNGPVQT